MVNLAAGAGKTAVAVAKVRQIATDMAEKVCPRLRDPRGKVLATWGKTAFLAISATNSAATDADVSLQRFFHAAVQTERGGRGRTVCRMIGMDTDGRGRQSAGWEIWK